MLEPASPHPASVPRLLLHGDFSLEKVRETGSQSLVPVLCQCDAVVSTKRGCHVCIVCIYLVQLTGKEGRRADSRGTSSQYWSI